MRTFILFLIWCALLGVCDALNAIGKQMKEQTICVAVNTDMGEK